MGRYINCKIGNEHEIVWKYRFGVQASDLHRISTELGIGEYHLIRYVDPKSKKEDEDFDYKYVTEDLTDAYGDVLILSRSDVEKLDTQIQALKEVSTSDTNSLFIAMTEAIRYFMVKNSERDRFIFEGEL
jgi:hypothetical protein